MNSSGRDPNSDDTAPAMPNPAGAVPGSLAADKDKIDVVRAGLLTWFARARRDLPWRNTRDPYRILVSEVMLQQTQVDRVIPYYEEFLRRFPTAEALAAAPAAELLAVWSGLGYNRRAINLQRTVRWLVEQCGGEWPRTADELRSLPGIGAYTSGALLAFAFEHDVAFLDTNMRRVIHRLFFGPDLPVAIANERQLLAVAAEVVPPGKGWEWNQALIEFGALVCTARKPVCVVCPLQQQCAAFPAIQGILKTLPAGTRKKQEAPYEGSNRYFRARVVETVVGSAEHGEGVDLLTLGAAIRPEFSPDDLPWLETLLQGLARDGLVSISEEAPAYDAGGGAAGKRVFPPD